MAEQKLIFLTNLKHRSRVCCWCCCCRCGVKVGSQSPTSSSSFFSNYIPNSNCCAKGVFERRWWISRFSTRDRTRKDPMRQAKLLIVSCWVSLRKEKHRSLWRRGALYGVHKYNAVFKVQCHGKHVKRERSLMHFSLHSQTELWTVKKKTEKRKRRTNKRKSLLNWSALE